jgi:hypothetical protein
VFCPAPHNDGIAFVRDCCDGDSCDWHAENLHGG